MASKALSNSSQVVLLSYVAFNLWQERQRRLQKQARKALVTAAVVQEAFSPPHSEEKKEHAPVVHHHYYPPPLDPPYRTRLHHASTELLVLIALGACLVLSIVSWGLAWMVLGLSIGALLDRLASSSYMSPSPSSLPSPPSSAPSTPVAASPLPLPSHVAPPRMTASPSFALAAPFVTSAPLATATITTVETTSTTATLSSSSLSSDSSSSDSSSSDSSSNSSSDSSSDSASPVGDACINDTPLSPSSPSLSDIFQAEEETDFATSEHKLESVDGVPLTRSALYERLDELEKSKKPQEASALLASVVSELCLDPELLFRAARNKYIMLKEVLQSNQEKKEFAEEGLRLAERALASPGGQQSAECHKWVAIMSSEAGEHNGTKARIGSAPVFQRHVLRALKLAPLDPDLHHMMGRFCYELSTINWATKRLVSMTLGSLPEVTLKDALSFFNRAHELKPNWIRNDVWLVKALRDSKKTSEARQLLEQVLSLVPEGEEDRLALAEAKTFSF